MGDWAQLAQSVILGLIFSYLLAKLISIVVTFKEDNLSLTRGTEPQSEIKPEFDSRRIDSSTGGCGGGEAYSLVAEQGSSRGGDSVGGDSDEDDDWEGVESTELDEAFSAATLFVTTAASDRLSQKVASDVQQNLYGLYKIATEGPCTAPQPSPLKMTARAKWYLSLSLNLLSHSLPSVQVFEIDYFDVENFDVLVSFFLACESVGDVLASLL